MNNNLQANRQALKHQFLQSYFLHQNFRVFAIPADASYRSYDRIYTDTESYILMNCPLEYYSLDPFINISNLLHRHEILNPKIHHIDLQNGFLLLQDLGDISIKQYCTNVSTDKIAIKQCYFSLIKLLTSLQKISIHNLSFYDNNILLEELSLYTDWYMPYVLGHTLSAERKKNFFLIWKKLLSKLPPLPSVFIHQDFHAENIFLLNEKSPHKFGLIDFQDAKAGCPIYDLVSLLEDARINVPIDLALECIEYYASLHPDLKIEDIYLAYHILGAQRNCRILGVFARKAIRDKQTSYLDYLPQVLIYLNNDLKHPALLSIKSWIEVNNFIYD